MKCEGHLHRKSDSPHPARLFRKLVKTAFAQQLVQGRVKRIVQRPDHTGSNGQLLLTLTRHLAYGIAPTSC